MNSLQEFSSFLPSLSPTFTPPSFPPSFLPSCSSPALPGVRWWRSHWQLWVFMSVCICVCMYMWWERTIFQGHMHFRLIAHSSSGLLWYWLHNVPMYMYTPRLHIWLADASAQVASPPVHLVTLQQLIAWNSQHLNQYSHTLYFLYLIPSLYSHPSLCRQVRPQIGGLDCTGLATYYKSTS